MGRVIHFVLLRSNCLVQLKLHGSETFDIPSSVVSFVSSVLHEQEDAMHAAPRA